MKPSPHTLAIVALAAILVAGLALPVGASDAMKAMLESYGKIHRVLVQDKLDGVTEESAAIAGQASRMGADGESIRAAAEKLSNAKDLETARAAFGALSDELIKRADAESWKDVTDAKVAFCPMAKKSWIQKGDKIQNPYYGRDMPTCGEFRKR